MKNRLSLRSLSFCTVWMFLQEHVGAPVIENGSLLRQKGQRRPESSGISFLILGKVKYTAFQGRSTGACGRRRSGDPWGRSRHAGPSPESLPAAFSCPHACSGQGTGEQLKSLPPRPDRGNCRAVNSLRPPPRSPPSVLRPSPVGLAPIDPCLATATRPRECRLLAAPPAS